MNNTWKLKLRMILSSLMLFGLTYFVIGIICSLLGITSHNIYLIISIISVFVEYLLGPKMVEKTMNVTYISPEESPKIHRMVDELAKNADIPKPKVGISHTNIPNAFAFGRRQKDGRVCVTTGILNLLDDDELKAVIGHEISHIKHRDMIVMTIITTIPLICYYIGWSLIYSNDDDGYVFLFGIGAFIAYAIGQLLVLFVSRVREYYADAGSVDIGCQPDKLASALFKLTYGSATANEDELKKAEGIRAFFVNDISAAKNEINDLSQLDLNQDGVISPEELRMIKESNVNIDFTSKLSEMLSTHPNMVKRVKRLSEL